jgi:hypothetical protein
MGLVVTCDNPECPNAGEPMDASKAVQMFVRVNDPETGPSEAQVFFDTSCGDAVLSALAEKGILLPE